MGDITPNISYSELRPYGSDPSWKPVSQLQDLMIQTLAKNIQIVIDKLQCHVTFSCGVRVQGDYQRLIKEGYNPSPTSDHYCSNVIPISPVTGYRGGI